MKKLLLAIFSLSILFQSVFAYSPTFKDILIVRQLSNAIEDLISDKGEEYRDIYLERLESIKIGYSHKERIVYIIDGTIEKLSPVDLVDDLLNELDGNDCTTEGKSYGAIGLTSEICCSGLEKLEYIAGSTICYDPNMGLPTCKYIPNAGLSYLTYPNGFQLGHNGNYFECDIEETTNSCTAEGEVEYNNTSSNQCCAGLERFEYWRPGASSTPICYEANNGTPTCTHIGTSQEGRYYPSGVLLKLDNECDFYTN